MPSGMLKLLLTQANWKRFSGHSGSGVVTCIALACVRRRSVST